MKVCVRPLGWYERPPLVPGFTNGKKSKEDLGFYGKKAKSEDSLQYWFCSGGYKRCPDPEDGEKGPTQLLPQEPTLSP